MAEGILIPKGNSKTMGAGEKAYLEKKLGKNYWTIPVRENVIKIDLFDLLREFETTLTQTIRAIMVNQGLDKTSDLVKSTDVGYKNDMFEVLALDYYQYVSKGRKPKARKVPVEALISWIKEKKIPYAGSINNAAFSIQQSIYRKGIQGKLYEESVIDFSTNTIDEVLSGAMQYGTSKGLVSEWQAFIGNKWVTVATKVKNK